MITITSKGNTLHKSFQGTYAISDPVNGAASWKSTSNLVTGFECIWYNAQCKAWIVGELNDLGTNRAKIFAQNVYGEILDRRNKWQANLMKVIAGTSLVKMTSMNVTCSCTLEVIFSNALLARYKNYQGTYKLSNQLVNGMPMWETRRGSRIWCNPHSFWVLGKSDMPISIYSRDLYFSPHKVPSDKWKYWNGFEWMYSSSNDIIIQIKGKCF